MNAKVYQLVGVDGIKTLAFSVEPRGSKPILDTNRIALWAGPTDVRTLWPSPRSFPTLAGFATALAARLECFAAPTARNVANLAAALADISPDLAVVMYVCEFHSDHGTLSTRRRPAVSSFVDGRIFDSHLCYFRELMDRTAHRTGPRWGVCSHIIPLYPHGHYHWAMGMLALHTELQDFASYRRQPRQAFAVVLSRSQGQAMDRKGECEVPCMGTA